MRQQSNRENIDTIPPHSGPFMISHAREWQGLRSSEMAVSASVDTDAQYPEELRTGASLYVQENIHVADELHWRMLTECQADLSMDALGFREYQELAALSHAAMPDAETYEAVQYINLVHDIGKNNELMYAVGLDPLGDSHDEGLRRLFLPEYSDVLAHFLPSYADPGMFTDKQRHIIEGVLSADFNFARFLQSQTSQEEIGQIATIPSDILSIIILHGIHDIGGVMGHKNLTSSLTLDSPTANRMLDAAHALLGSADDLGLETGTKVTPNMRLGAYLSLRAHRLKALLPENATDIERAEYIVQLDIANLLKCNTPEEFETVKTAYTQLPELLRTGWTMNQAAPLTSLEEPSSMQKYGTEYLPAFLRAAVRRGDANATYIALGYFSQVLTQATTLEIMEASVNDGEWPKTPAYNQVNFYHLAKTNMQTDGVNVVYKQTGRTLTPIVVDQSYAGPELRCRLVHPDSYKVEV